MGPRKSYASYTPEPSAQFITSARLDPCPEMPIQPGPGQQRAPASVLVVFKIWTPTENVHSVAHREVLIRQQALPVRFQHHFAEQSLAHFMLQQPLPILGEGGGTDGQWPTNTYSDRCSTCAVQAACWRLRPSDATAPQTGMGRRNPEVYFRSPNGGLPDERVRNGDPLSSARSPHGRG